VALSRLTRGAVGGSFTRNIRIAFGHGCDCPSKCQSSLLTLPHPRSVKYKRARQKANSYQLIARPVVCKMVSVTFISRIWKGRYIVSVFLAFLCLGAGGWRLMHQWHYYDKTKVTPYLSMLKEPLKSVRLQSYMDGGSVGIELTSAEGK